MFEFKGQLHIPVVDGHTKPAEASHCEELEHILPYPSNGTSMKNVKM